MTDIADILEQLEEDGGGGGIVERQNGSGSADGPHPSRHLSLVRHAEHADVAALRVQHPAEMLKSLSQLPPSYALCDADAATDDMPALSDALTVDGWAFAEHTDESPRVGSNADVARYVQRTGRIVQLPSLVNNSVQPEAQGLDAERRRRQMYTRSRGFVLLDAAPEWGLCGAAVVRTAAGASELVGLLEGRIQPSSTPTDSFDAQRLGAYVDVRAVAHLVEAPRETEAATPATADAVRSSAAIALPRSSANNQHQPIDTHPTTRSLPPCSHEQRGAGGAGAGGRSGDPAGAGSVSRTCRLAGVSGSAVRAGAQGAVGGQCTGDRPGGHRGAGAIAAASAAETGAGGGGAARYAALGPVDGRVRAAGTAGGIAASVRGQDVLGAGARPLDAHAGGAAGVGGRRAGRCRRAAGASRGDVWQYGAGGEVGHSVGAGAVVSGGGRHGAGTDYRQQVHAAHVDGPGVSDQHRQNPLLHPHDSAVQHATAQTRSRRPQVSRHRQSVLGARRRLFMPGGADGCGRGAAALLATVATVSGERTGAVAALPHPISDAAGGAPPRAGLGGAAPPHHRAQLARDCRQLLAAATATPGGAAGYAGGRSRAGTVRRGGGQTPLGAHRPRGRGGGVSATATARADHERLVCRCQAADGGHRSHRRADRQGAATARSHPSRRDERVKCVRVKWRAFPCRAQFVLWPLRWGMRSAVPVNGGSVTELVDVAAE
eukprot:ctg_378.g142